MAAYRYWRLYVADINNAGTAAYCIISEIELRTSPGGADVTTPATMVSAKSNYPGHAATNTVDNDLNTYWQTAAGDVSPTNPTWLIFDLGSPKDIVEYTIRNISSATYTSPKSFDLQASADGSTWAPFKQSVPDQVGWAVNETRTFQVYQALVVGGVAKLDTGVPASEVLVYLWDAPYTLLGRTVPAVDGKWAMVVASSVDTRVLVTTRGPTGYQPITHGPVVPVAPT